MEEIICSKCGLINEYRTVPSGPHLKAICNGCDRYIKFISKPKNEVVIYFGKYSQTAVKDIMDRNYLHWLYENHKTLKPRLREAIKIQIDKLISPNE